MSRIIIISNRLPVTISDKNGDLKLKPSAGGLATGMQSLSSSHEIIWVGWPGVNTTNKQRSDKIRRVLVARDYYPVFIDKTKFSNYYNGFSNSTLWPLSHYFQQFTEINETTWKDYEYVNTLFAREVINIARKGDIFWVQDYQLMLVPQLLRNRFPKSAIGYFHHIPFPSYELVRTLPWREQLLKGLLGADLIGFHTYDYVRHFISSVNRILHYDDRYLGRLRFLNRVVDIDSFPMGIDYDKFARSVFDKDTKKEIKRYRQTIRNEKIVLTIDRLDYSKALPQRILAFERFLNKYASYRGEVSMLIILVPSRDTVREYKALKEEIDKLVGHINGKYGRIAWTPIHYYYRAIKFPRLVAWYKIAPVALITPMRDGMNLVAKEYLACKDDGKGVLILSERAGAAKELVAALQVNPDDTDDIADAIRRALEMSEEEQIGRNRKMQAIIKRKDVNYWAKNFLLRLQEVNKAALENYKKHFGPVASKGLLEKYHKANRRLIFLDYDGTLVNFRSNPLLANPTKRLHEVLEELAGDSKNKVVLISGRDRAILQKWFGDTRLDMVAEHGVWYRKDQKNWKEFQQPDVSWKKELAPVFEEFVDRTPGSFLEEKNYSLAWHYRKTDTGLAEIRKHEFMDKMSQDISGKNLQIMEGNKVLEIKNSEVNKGTAAQHWIEERKWPFILAIGDDYTDEDTFKALPEHGISLKVGFSATAANYNIDSVEDVMKLLTHLCHEK